MKIVELLNALKKEDYEKDVDLHIHSNISDGTLTPLDIVEQALQKGLTIISITDHNSILAHLKNDFSKCENIEVITGVEFDCWLNGVFIHILGYGFDANDPKIQELCRQEADSKNKFKRFFSTRSPQKVIGAIKSAGGVSSFAHPACSWAINLEHFTGLLKNMGLDAIEAYYPYSRHRKIIKFHSSKLPNKIADKLGLMKTGGTDEHSDLV